MTDKKIRIVLDSRSAEKNAKNFDKTMVGAGASADKTAFSVNKLASAIGGLIAIQQVNRFFQDSIKTFGQFEQSMAKVRAITRATDQEFEQLTATAREMGATTEFTASQAAGGLQFLGQAGFTASEAIAALPQVLNLATAAGLDLANAADIASNIMSGYGIAAENSEKVTDLLAATASRANTNVSQMGDAMSFVAPVAASMGIEIEDTSAAIGALSDAGIQGGRAGTSLRRVITSLVNPLGQAKDTLKELNISMEEINPETNNLVDIISLLDERVTDGADAMRLFGEEGGPAFLALTEQLPRLRDLSTELRNVEGEAARMAETMRDTLTGDLNALNSATQDLQITLVDTFDKELRESVQNTTNVVRLLSDNMDNIATVVEYLAVILGTRLAVALTASAIAFARTQAGALKATVQVNAFGQVVSRTTALQNGFNMALRAGSRLMSLAGGLPGIIAIAATTFLTYRDNVKEATNANNILADSIEGVTRAQARQQIGNVQVAITKETLARRQLKQEIEDLENSLNSEREATLRGMVQREEDTARLSEAQVEYEKTSEKVRELTQRLADLKQITSGGDEYGFMPGEDPFEGGGSIGRSDANVRPSSGNSEESSRSENDGSDLQADMEATTAELQRQLEARRQISQLYREANLEDINHQFERERELLRVQTEERLVNLAAENETEKERRALRFEERLENMKLNEERERELKQEFKEQELTRDHLFEEQKNTIEEKAAEKRKQIAKQETDAKINTYSQMASAGLSIISAFGKKSVAMQRGVAILESGIAITAGVAKALNNPFPANLAFAAKVAAQGATLVSKLKSIGDSNSGGGGSVSTSTPNISSSTSASAESGRATISDTSQQRENKFVLDFRGLDDEDVLTGKMLKNITKKLEDGAEFGRAVYSE